jgi:DNA-binding response OmpR family regulator
MDDHPSIVVIGEPDQATSALYQRTLGGVFTVLAAHDDVTILELLRSHPVAAVVIEPALFAANSWEQLQTVGRACAEAGTALVICSTQDERRKGRDLGAAAYLVKPTLPATLLETLRQLLKPSVA